jgi:hypothetical protein
MAEILYYVVRLEVLSWKIAKHGLSSILENIVCLSRKTSQWLARCIPNNVYGSGGGSGIDGAKGERVQASVPR